MKGTTFRGKKNQEIPLWLQHKKEFLLNNSKSANYKEKINEFNYTERTFIQENTHTHTIKVVKDKLPSMRRYMHHV